MPKMLPSEEKYSPYTSLVGLKFDGYARCILETRQELLNVNGTVHGGAIYAIADVGMGRALFEHLEEDEICSTIEIKIGYFAPATSGLLVGESKMVHRTRRLAFMESTIANEGRLIAKAVGTFYILRDEGKGQ